MSQSPLTPLFTAPLASGETRREYLGPATVFAFDGPDVTVRLSNGDDARAQLALAYPYRPAIGDVLLVIGQRDAAETAHYVIGVLQGSGRAALHMQGDVELCAVDGELTLRGDRGVALRGPELDVTVGRMQVLSDKLVNKCDTIYQRARKLYSLVAKDSQQLVQGEMVARAKNASVVTEEKMSFNGKQIHLG
jgi:hypothetical protein